MWGLYSHECEYRKIFLRNFFWNMYSHFGPCPLYWYSACIHTSRVPIHKNILGELISVQIHAAHVSAPAQIQENIPGELFMYWFRARGYVWWTFWIFFFFFLLGEGEGGIRGAGEGGGWRLFIENPRRGGGLPGRWGQGGDGAGRVFAGNGGGGNFFFGAEEFPPNHMFGKP